MPTSWSASNRLHASNQREESAKEQILEYGIEALDEVFEDDEEHEIRMRDEAYDAWEAAQLQKLDEIHDGDWY